MQYYELIPTLKSLILFEENNFLIPKKIVIF